MYYYEDESYHNEHYRQTGWNMERHTASQAYREYREYDKSTWTFTQKLWFYTMGWSKRKFLWMDHDTASFLAVIVGLPGTLLVLLVTGIGSQEIGGETYKDIQEAYQENAELRPMIDAAMEDGWISHYEWEFKGGFYNNLDNKIKAHKRESAKKALEKAKSNWEEVFDESSTGPR